jgi:hypothetical protein
MPAYNAETTLMRTVAELDRKIVDEIVLVDDASTDQIVALSFSTRPRERLRTANRMTCGNAGDGVVVEQGREEGSAANGAEPGLRRPSAFPHEPTGRARLLSRGGTLGRIPAPPRR